MFRARQLLAAAKPSASKSPFVKNWLSDKATYPIIGIMACAIGLVAFQCQRIALSHPDVTFDKSDRSTAVRDNDDEAEDHYEHALRQYSRQGNTRIFGTFSDSKNKN